MAEQQAWKHLGPRHPRDTVLPLHRPGLLREGEINQVVSSLRALAHAVPSAWNTFSTSSMPCLCWPRPHFSCKFTSAKSILQPKPLIPTPAKLRSQHRWNLTFLCVFIWWPSLPLNPRPWVSWEEGWCLSCSLPCSSCLEHHRHPKVSVQ